MPFTIVRQDITKIHVDAIVNAANTHLKMGSGVCGAIFHAAGVKELQSACDQIAPIPVGGAALTPGFLLPAKYIIHAAGPIYYRCDRKKAAYLLRQAYLQSLRLAASYGCESIAFPLISSGNYGYPKAEAMEIATAAIRDFLADHDMQVYLAVFDKTAFMVSEQLMGEVKSYIDEHYVDTHYQARRQRFWDAETRVLKEADDAPDVPDASGTFDAAGAPNLQDAASMLRTSPAPYAAPSMASPFPDGLIAHLDEPFSDTLFKLIDAKGKTDVEVYKRANIDRKLFSKIRSVKGYTPKKATILALAIALELSLQETDDLLKRAGYALSHASKFDVIVEYFIINRKYNIFDINEVLFQYDQPLLGT